MTEWLILILVVPAVVVPVVMLAGFAGCDQVFGLHRLEDGPPVIVSAEGKNGTTITLTWTYAGTATEFEFERMKLPERTRRQFKAATSPHDDDNESQGLEPNTNYLYRVRAILSDGEPGGWSSPEPNIPGSTLPFETTFAWTAEEQARSRDATGWQGYCLIQRIEANRLSRSGTQVKLSLRASFAANASIERVYISRPNPAPGKNPYESDIDLTPVLTTTIMVPANNSVVLPNVQYSLDAEQPLLVAIDFSAASASAIRVVDNLPSEEASAYSKIASADAANQDRTGYTQTAQLFLIEKIEVG